MDFNEIFKEMSMNISIEFWRDFGLWASKVLLFRVETQPPTKSNLGRFCVSRIPRISSHSSAGSQTVNLALLCTDRLGEACC